MKLYIVYGIIDGFADEGTSDSIRVIGIYESMELANKASGKELNGYIIGEVELNKEFYLSAGGLDK